MTIVRANKLLNAFLNLNTVQHQCCSRDGRLWNLYARLLATKVIAIMTIIAKYSYVTNAMLTNHVSMGTIYIAIAIATSLIVKAT